MRCPGGPSGVHDRLLEAVSRLAPDLACRITYGLGVASAGEMLERL
jgi:hypothetical protein